MSKVVRRGFVESDRKQFKEEAVQNLRKAATEVLFLLDHGYDMKPVTTFVGNHYCFSERQRLALARSIASRERIQERAGKKESLADLSGTTVCMDGFNTIITLEVALSRSLLIRGMDGCIRDLAGLRGTYRIIDATREAISLVLKQLEQTKVAKLVIYLDAPVSNSGRLKQLIQEIAIEYSFVIEIQVVTNVDQILEQREHVITSDGIILNRCKSWVNLLPMILEEIEDVWIVDIMPNKN